MATLYFDSAACSTALHKRLQATADILIEEYENEIRQGMGTPEGAESVRRGLSKDDKVLLHREVIGGAWAILDSYGYGSKMDTNNPYLQQYRQSGLWNPNRYTLRIVGRPGGQYTNMFGQRVKSSGRMAGRSLEKKYPPKAPSKAFQNALIWFMAGNRIEKRVRECIRSFNFAAFFKSRK